MSIGNASLKLCLSVLLVYAVLVATHRGEFWPMSIYPMFSQAGRPWSRVVVRSLPNDAPVEDVGWDARPLDALPGDAFAVNPRGVDAIDLANFVVKSKVWDAPTQAGLHRLFHDQLDSRTLIVTRVDGRLVDGSVEIDATPVAVVQSSGVTVNPALATSEAN